MKLMCKHLCEKIADALNFNNLCFFIRDTCLSNCVVSLISNSLHLDLVKKANQPGFFASLGILKQLKRLLVHLRSLSIDFPAHQKSQNLRYNPILSCLYPLYSQQLQNIDFQWLWLLVMFANANRK